MQALVYAGPHQISWTTVPDPQIQEESDIVVRVDTSTICGTDLHILKGDVPEVTPGRILGHEAIATVVEIGKGVRSVQKDDRVIVSCVSACGRCTYCRRQEFGQCLNGGGWILGHTIDGLQAEFARLPFADNSVYHIPPGLTDEQVIYLSDILPTGYEVGVLNGQISPGDIVAVVGAGPIGLSAMLTARLYSPASIVAIDPNASRRALATQFGATDAVSPEDARETIDRLTDGLGADVTIEAVGIPQTFEQCTELVRAGGHIANIGVHGEPVMLHLERLWTRNVTITTGLVNTRTIPSLLSAIESSQIDPSAFTTHRFALDQMMDAYDTFGRASETGALKVLVGGTPTPATSRAPSHAVNEVGR